MSVTSTERFRLYTGSTELDYSTCRIEKSSDHLIDNGKAHIQKDTDVTIGSTLDIRKSDGATTVFDPAVKTRRKTPSGWALTLLSKGKELHGKRIQNVYTAQTPEAIVEDIIDRTDTLTFASTATSGITLDGDYVANGYMIDVIKDMIHILDWQFRIDSSNNVYFEPKGNIDNGVSWTGGTDCQIEYFEDDGNDVINHVEVTGGFANHSYEETVAGTQKTFDLSFKPEGSLRATVSGSIVDTADYSVDAENKQVTFTTNKTNPTFNYTFNRPIVIDYQDDDSISDHTETFKPLEAPWLTNFADVRSYAKEYVDIHKDPPQKALAIRPGLDVDIAVGEKIRLIDNERGEDEYLVITKIVYVVDKMRTEVHMGTRDYVIGDWQAEVQDRIKTIERRIKDMATQSFSRSFSHDMEVDLSLNINFSYRSPVDSFILGHQTLGRLRSSLNMEADCSDNLRNGTWNGTGIDGSQFNTSTAWRLSSGEFNGSDNYINLNDDPQYDPAGGYSIFLAFNNSDTTQTGARLYAEGSSTDNDPLFTIGTGQSDGTLLRIYIRNDSSAELLAQHAATTIVQDAWNTLLWTDNNGTCKLYINGVEDANSVAGSFDYTPGTVTLDRTAVGAILRAAASNFFEGYIDEVRVYSRIISEEELSQILNKIQINEDLELYWSMDNPRLGDRRGSTAEVT